MNLIIKSLSLSILLLFSFAAAVRAQALYELPEGVESRWASPENPTGQKGRAGTAAGRRKGSPTIRIRARYQSWSDLTG